ncbi:hypothetical protein RHMOL_Rhmol13G0033800 [Rhododendron molle]|uniref:Uncharacterized protein n=1 Tax=Rhododendron molle TaxID=49168 RepID=A0ACC0L324_RHOML|nr:hypothetical protein RHMOL_Rhmol13G0033800 [Rhododendron molle]
MSFLRTNLEFYLHKSELESRTASTGKSSSLLRTASELPTEKLNKSIVLVLDVKYFLLHISQEEEVTMAEKVVMSEARARARVLEKRD